MCYVVQLYNYLKAKTITKKASVVFSLCEIFSSEKYNILCIVLPELVDNLWVSHSEQNNFKGTVDMHDAVVYSHTIWRRQAWTD